MFSKTYGYALRAATYVVLHGREDQKVSLQDLSAALDVPHHFLGKIMQDLVRHEVLESTKGPNGGFYPNSRTRQLNLLEILKITDGSIVFSTCLLGIRHCNAEKPCPMHTDFGRCRDGLLESLRTKTLQNLADEVSRGAAFLVR
jgi:Rrf2 family protein